MNIMELLEPYTEHNYNQMVAWRRYLHQYPELSFQEKQTSAWVQKQLEEIGCEVTRCKHSHGLTVTIKGEKEGPVVALRADMDGLPIQDEKDVDYASKVPGVMHACGHDAHTAVLLAIAQFYNQHRHLLEGQRRLIFQPAEELAPGGAASMIAEGALQDVDVIYGVHLWTPLQYGKVATKAGNFMSAVDDFSVEIKGLGGHGGVPHHTVDAIIIGSSIVQGLQTIVSRNINPISPAVVTVGTFQAGHANNVIAERCLIKGTIRTFDEESRQIAQQKVERTIQKICELHGATSRYELKKGYPAVVNDEHEANRVLEVAQVVVGADNTELAAPIMIAEDFAFYLKEVPGCFMFVGAGNVEIGASYAHHHPRFDLDERSMKLALKMLVSSAEHYVQRQE